MAVQQWWQAAADLILGATCPGCERPGAGLCRACRSLLGARGVCEVDHDTLPVFSAGSYDETARRVLEAWKERQAWGLRRVLGERLMLAAAAALMATDHPGRWWLVPMPSTPGAVRRRGMDVTAALAAEAARGLRRAGVDARPWRALTGRRRLRDQTGLGVAERHSNVAGAFRLRTPPRDGHVLLVDDIVTTGATLSEAHRVLCTAGARVAAAAVIADTPRRSAQS
ncbi:MAG: ComF family protein [Propionibacterium sp.]|nr:ComF family protein [Propionibacterium sp.]